MALCGTVLRGNRTRTGSRFLLSSLPTYSIDLMKTSDFQRIPKKLEVVSLCFILFKICFEHSLTSITGPLQCPRSCIHTWRHSPADASRVWHFVKQRNLIANPKILFTVLYTGCDVLSLKASKTAKQ